MKLEKGIHTQVPGGQLLKWPVTAKHCLNYENINDNYRWKLDDGSYDCRKFSYNVRSAKDFAKLFLQGHLARFSDFTQCEVLALLNLLCSVPVFPSVVQEAAKEVKMFVRHKLAHFDIQYWTDENFTRCFNSMEKLAKLLCYYCGFNQENQLLEKLAEYKVKGIMFCYTDILYACYCF